MAELTREQLKNFLSDQIKLGNASKPEVIFVALVFCGGTNLSNTESLDRFKQLFNMAIEMCEDEMALALLNMVHACYQIIEKEIETKKLASGNKNWNFTNATKRADDKFFEFIIIAYSTIGYKGREPIMNKTKFQILEYASKQWVQKMTDESYVAFRFLVKAFESQEKKEILDKILRPRVENWFKNVELIEQWLLYMPDPVPYEIQQLLVMARAKNGGPELAKRDIANSMAKKRECTCPR